METSKKTFYGPLKIEYVIDLEDDTVEILFTNGKKEIVTKKTFAISITEEQKDWNYLQEVKMKAIMEEVMPIVFSYDLKMYEANALLSTMGKNVKERYHRAINYLWTKDDTQYVEGSDPTDFFSLVEAEKTIKSIPVKDVPKTE